jgi:hypothetical protein
MRTLLVSFEEGCMPVVPAKEFVRGFEQYRDQARREVVKVTSEGQVIGAFLSASDLELFERLKRYKPDSLVVGELPDDVVAAIEAAEYGVEPK